MSITYGTVPVCNFLHKFCLHGHQILASNNEIYVKYVLCPVVKKIWLNLPVLLGDPNNDGIYQNYGPNVFHRIQ